MLEHTAVAKKFYKSRAWKRCRDAYFNSQHGICERCTGVGLIVHHKIYIDIDNINDPVITLDWRNLELVCQSCHNNEHFKGANRIPDDCYFDGKGNLKYKDRS